MNKLFSLIQLIVSYLITAIALAWLVCYIYVYGIVLNIIIPAVFVALSLLLFRTSYVEWQEEKEKQWDRK